MVVPTNTTLEQWIEQSKAYGTSLKQRVDNSQANRNIDVNYGGAMDLDQSMRRTSNNIA